MNPVPPSWAGHGTPSFTMQVYVLGVLEIIALIRSLIFFISEMKALIREYIDVYPTRLLAHACSSTPARTRLLLHACSYTPALTT